MPPPGQEQRRRADLVAAVLAEGRPVQLDDAELLIGWENAVLRSTDGWIYRFPRLGREAYERELRVLDALAGRLPARIPEIAWTGRHTQFAVYRTITGADLDLRQLVTAPAARAELAASLAAFLAAMHASWTPTEAAALGIDVTDTGAMVTAIAGHLSMLSPSGRARVDRVLQQWDATCGEPGDRVVLHNDFHPGNMVFATPVGPLTGIWDFSCVALGDPSEDLRYLVCDDAELAADVARRYAEATGRALDLERTRLLAAIEWLSDAVAEDRPLEPLPALV